MPQSKEGQLHMVGDASLTTLMLSPNLRHSKSIAFFILTHMKHLTFAALCLFTFDSFAQGEAGIQACINVKKNYRTNILAALTPITGNENGDVTPYLGLQLLKEDQTLSSLQVYAGLGLQQYSATGRLDYFNSDFEESIDGKIKASFGLYAPFIGAKYFLKKGDTRPYINAQRTSYLPIVNARMEVEIAQVGGSVESYEFTSSAELGRLFRNAIGFTSTEVGFGVEHMLDENIALFAECNLNTFAFKVKVRDAEEFVAELENALNDIETDLDTDLDVSDLDVFEGDASAALRRRITYASLGLAIYF